MGEATQKKDAVREQAVISVDVERLQTLGKEVVEAMRSLRELLSVRADALEACRTALEEYQRKLAQDRETLASEQMSLCSQFDVRQHDLEQAGIEVEAQRNALAEAEARFKDERSRWESQKVSISDCEARLEEERGEITTLQASLETQKASLARDEEALKQREASLVEMTSAVNEREQALARQQEELAGIRQEWDARMREIKAAQDGLAALQSQLEGELGKVAEQKNDLLPRFGATDPTSGSAPRADQGIPAVPPETDKARSALERFQKLCRDAKRRAIGV